MNIATLLREQARLRPTAPAILDTWHGRPRMTTCAELELASARAAALLWQEGLRPGDAVLVFAPMSAELYVALIAIFRLGLVATFVDPSAGRAHVEQCCALRPPQALVASTRAQALRLLLPALRRIPRHFVLGVPVPGAIPWSRAASLAPRDEIAPCDPDTPALLTFTSGSTGQPRAALRSHGLLLAQQRVLEQTLGGAATSGAVGLTTMPVFVLADLAAGVTSLLPVGDLRAPARIDPAPVVAQIETYRPVRAGASPAFWERIVRYCEHQGRTLPHLQRIYVGGAPVFPSLLERLQRRAPQAEIVAVYGSTEAEPIAHIGYHQVRPDDIAAMLSGSGLLAGPPVSAIQLRIVPDQWGTPLGTASASAFAACCLPAERPGEIVVSGAHVLPGYVDGHGDQETKFRVDGTIWHRTGDAGYLDAAGRLWLLGRCAARVDDDRGRLYPFAVECAIAHHPQVRRAAFVSRAGRRLLALDLYQPLSPPELDALASTVAWARLDEVRVLRHIPVDRRHNAKIDYPALYRLLERP